MMIVVLNDGETYSDIRGCVIMNIPDGIDVEDIEEYIYEHYDDGILMTDVA